MEKEREVSPSSTPEVVRKEDITYGDLTRILEEARDIYSTHEGLTFLLGKRQEAIAILMEVAGDKIKGILSTGYPNYQLPDISLPDATTALTKEQFIPIAEIQSHIGTKLDFIKDRNPKEKWPCLHCRAAVEQTPLRSREHGCTSSMTPFALFTAIPDIDLYIVVESFEDAEDIIRTYETAGLNVPENQMQESLKKFPAVLNIDPQFVLKKDIMKALHEIVEGSGDWRKIPLPLLVHHGKPEMKQINHLGLDFAFSMIDHTIPDPELKEVFVQARMQLIQNKGLDTIVNDMKETSSSTELPRRIGRLIEDHPHLEARLRARLAQYATQGTGS